MRIKFGTDFELWVHRGGNSSPGPFFYCLHGYCGRYVTVVVGVVLVLWLCVVVVVVVVAALAVCVDMAQVKINYELKVSLKDHIIASSLNLKLHV